jgi:hypothetical protein
MGPGTYSQNVRKVQIKSKKLARGEGGDPKKAHGGGRDLICKNLL